jgi:hypothetical protein
LRVHWHHSGSSKGSKVGLLRLLPLILLVLFAQEAVGGLVHGPRHVVFAPVVSILAHFFLALFTILLWLFLPGFTLLLFPLVVSILLVLSLLLPFYFPSFIIALSLGSNLSWPLSTLRAAVIATIFSLSGDLAPQSPLVFSQSKLCFADVMRAL